MNIKKTLFVAAAAFLGVCGMNAKTTVNLYIPNVPNSELTLIVDGKDMGKIDLPKGKVTKSQFILLPLEETLPCFQPIEFTKEGPVKLEINWHYVNAADAHEWDYKAEGTIDLADGQTLDIEMDGNPTNEIMVFRQIEPKKAVKYHKDKKTVTLTPIVVE